MNPTKKKITMCVTIEPRVSQLLTKVVPKSGRSGWINRTIKKRALAELAKLSRAEIKDNLDSWEKTGDASASQTKSDSEPCS